VKKRFPLIPWLSVAAIAAFFSSCGVQSKSNYTVNPDLTCKCVFEEKLGLDVAMITTNYGGAANSSDPTGLSSMFGSDTSRPSAHDILFGFANKILSNKGVDTWKDVEFKMIGQDTVYFKGTAYFKSLSNGGLSGIDSGMRIYDDDMGQTVIEMKQSKKDTESSSMSNVYKNLFKGGMYYSMMHYYMAALLRDFNISVTYQLPGKIVSISNFTKLNDNTAQLAFNGKSMIHHLDTLMMNTDMMSRMYTNPSSGIGALSSDDPYHTNSFIFGEDKPVRVIYKSGNKPLFDYEKEVAEAKKQYADFRKKSGLQAYDSIANAKKKMEEEERKKEEGTLVLNADDSANGKVYFKNLTAKQYYRSYATFTGQLSKSFNTSYYSTVIITSALTDNGKNVTDSIQNHDFISAYMSSSTTNYDDTITPNDKVTFTLNNKFPDDCKYINVEGKLVIDSATSVPFKIINLYLSTKAIPDGEDYEQEK
jgi:hypothetical protein